MLLDTGMRRSELTGLAVDDVDLDQDVALVLGKGQARARLPLRQEASDGRGVPVRIEAGYRGASASRRSRGDAGSGIGDTGCMAARDRVPVTLDPDQMETVRQVAEWTDRSEDEVLFDALTAYLDDQVMAVANEEVHAVRAERRAHASTRAAT